MRWKLAAYAESLLLAFLVVRWAWVPESGALIDLLDIPDNVVCKTVARDSVWYIITVPAKGQEGGWRMGRGVYYFGPRLPQYFFKVGEKIHAVKSLSEPEPIEWPENPGTRSLPDRD